jgi:hypothetical protein
MPVSPAASIPPLSPGEMQLLLSRTGLALNPGQVADLVLAWRQVAGLIASMPRDRPLADDMACAFRLAPPPVSVPATARPKSAGTARKSKAAAPRPKVAPPKRAAPRPAGRKAGKRGR